MNPPLPPSDPAEDRFVREHMQKMARMIHAELPEGWAFFLFCAPVEEREGRANYVSKMTRESAIACMKEFIAKQTDSGTFGTHEQPTIPPRKT